MATRRGRFIAFEGGEAAGKSTQAARLADRLDAVLTREPGGTQLGEVVRNLLLDPSQVGLSNRAEALLFAAARAQLVAEVIKPALDSGRDVVCDRFAGSSMAYQSYGRGLDHSAVWSLSAFAVEETWPDLNVLLVVPEALAEARIGERDRLEQAGPEFHRRVAQGFDALSQADPDRWERVEAGGSLDEVAARVWSVVSERLDG